ncbi:acetyltransferase [Clostridium puniceum]|uniref:Acetyltransferase n=1 Tax=Clostridium puniceum TaxID=29367 RepID=A0A1S8TJI5_9CLOT|nr:N-acetyltransferase [Clostridium puniceum]OOM77565.1 acetyltransferase [Clostridium puniceum]
MELRLENEKDYYEVENLTRDAFWNVYRPGCDEHLVIHNLRQSDSFIKELDYVLIENNQIVGNIVYSKMFVGLERKMSNDVIGFGPISVHPDFQRKGIGKKMIEYTLNEAKKLGYKAVLITGNNNYYNPLGFESASRYSIYLPGMSEDDEAVYFMAKELEEGYLNNVSGIYDFNTCFDVDENELEIFEQKFSRKVKRESKETDLR